jgi:hypothetical protein
MLFHSFASLLVNPTSGANFDDFQNITVLVEQYPPSTNPQPITVPPLKFFDLTRQSCGICGIDLNLFPDQSGLVSRHSTQKTECLFAVCDYKHTIMLADREHNFNRKVA